MTYAQLGWWLGHALELDGILVVGIPVALDLARTRAVAPARRRPRRGRARARRGALPRLARPRAHDRARPPRRRTPSSTRAASRCAPCRSASGSGSRKRHLRTLAIGGLLHDIGKLAVPDAILKKPGPLDDDEYAVIKRHPEWGTRLLDQIGGFPKSVRRLVRDHHERLDGARLPERPVGATQLDLDTRILTVCDVYDALISSRVYRPPWTHQEAMALLREQVGTAFDARCVDALAEVLDREAGREDELDARQGRRGDRSLSGPQATAWAS